MHHRSSSTEKYVFTESASKRLCDVRCCVAVNDGVQYVVADMSCNCDFVTIMSTDSVDFFVRLRDVLMRIAYIMRFVFGINLPYFDAQR